MAAAWFSTIADSKRAIATSAGTEPAVRVHPEVVAVMREVGIDLEMATPKFLSNDLAREASLLVTMGCGESCPAVPGLEREDWPLEDPKGKSLDEVRAIRDVIRDEVTKLVRQRGWGRAA
jgi:arsenate reductase